jgi:hypothetical protein
MENDILLDRQTANEQEMHRRMAEIQATWSAKERRIRATLGQRRREYLALWLALGAAPAIRNGRSHARACRRACK